MKKTIKIIGILLLAVLVCAAGLFGWLTLREYRPAPSEPLPVEGAAAAPLPASGTLRILSWNTGYAGLGREADFFMDGGKNVVSADKAQVEDNLAHLQARVEAIGADLVLLQEVDADSARTYGIDQRNAYTGQGRASAFALNYACDFVPFPLPPIGRVHSGILTVSRYATASATRLSLPSPFTWPVSTANLKRCLLVTRHPLADGRELVLVNLHLEAYDNGEGKLAQTAMLKEILEGEYAKGNPVIAGGDFNQSFPEAVAAYPILSPDLWTPGILSNDDLGEGWRFAYDYAVPTCRSLDRPYDPADPTTQHYVIDGFLLSPNVTLEAVETLDEGFLYTDHNPVLLTIQY